MRVDVAEEWDCQRAVRDLIENTPELRDLYGRLGYSVYVAGKCRKLLAVLEDVEVTVPDFHELETSLDSALAEIERHAGGEDVISPFWFANRELFDSVVNARANQDEVLRLLNADYREKLPISVEIEAVTRRPRSPNSFAGALDELDHLLRNLWHPQKQDVREELLEAVSEVREEFENEGDSFATSLGSLVNKIGDSVFTLADDQEQDERKNSLDDVLGSFVYTRHEDQPQNPDFIELVADEAKVYIDSSWMHTRWLTVFILRHLLDGEIGRQVPAGVSQKGVLWSFGAIALLSIFNLKIFAAIWLAVLFYYIGFTVWHMHKTKPLVTCRQEVGSGNYDGHEVARRLRDRERSGVVVHSLILRLLELHAR